MLVWQTWMRLMYPTSFLTASIFAVEVKNPAAAAVEPAPAGCTLLEEEEGADDVADCALVADAAAVDWLSVCTADLKEKRRWMDVPRVSRSRSRIM